ncbi:MAG: hypothetical protein AAF715_24680 [Myxococcota bacterium]
MERGLKRAFSPLAMMAAGPPGWGAPSPPGPPGWGTPPPPGRHGPPGPMPGGFGPPGGGFGPGGGGFGPPPKRGGGNRGVWLALGLLVAVVGIVASVGYFVVQRGGGGGLSLSRDDDGATARDNDEDGAIGSKDAVAALETLLDDVGDKKILKVMVYPGYAMVETLDGDETKKFQIRGGRVSPLGDGMPARGDDPKEDLFAVADLDLEVLPDIVDEARDQVDDDDITMVTCARPLVLGGPPRWTVHYEGSTTLMFDLKGKLVGGRKGGKEIEGIGDDFFAEPERARAMLLDRFGDDVVVMSVNLYRSYGVAEVRDATNSDHVDRFTFRNGAVGKGDPVRLRHKGNELNRCTTRLADADFAQVTKLIADGARRVDMPAENLSHVIFHDFACQGRGFTFNVYFRDERTSGFVVYEASGTFRRMHK